MERTHCIVSAIDPIQALKQLRPKHSEQFEAFPKFPTSADDVPPQWRSAWKDWDANALAAGQIGDEIDKPENLARFPDEGVLGSPTDEKLQADLTAQCHEMETEIRIIRENLKPGEDTSPPTDPLPVETGFFHEHVSRARSSDLRKPAESVQRLPRRNPGQR